VLSLSYQQNGSSNAQSERQHGVPLPGYQRRSVMLYCTLWQSPPGDRVAAPVAERG